MPAPGLYLHIPFCSEVCPYCDFAVVKGSARKRGSFVAALGVEMGLVSEDWEPFDTIYFGGGTPSYLPPEELGEILAAVRAWLPLAAAPWIFLEANPEDVTAESARAWRELGVVTVSLGVQSFDAGELTFLGRRHGPEEARRAVEICHEAGFATVSLDLIYGLPGQSRAAVRRNLEIAVALAPDHLSCYQLTVHEGTPFGRRLERGDLAELAEGEQAEHFTEVHGFLADAGYPAYEVSNFARAPEHRSRHNRKYWDHTPYLGLGPSAHSYAPALCMPGQGAGGERWWNERKPGPYEGRLRAGERPVAGRETLSREQEGLEALMLGLRTVDGIDLAAFSRRYGFDLAQNNATLLTRLREEGLIADREGTIAPTPRGLAVADSLAAAFVLG